VQFLPIPSTLEHLGALRPLWGPFLLRISERSGRSFSDLSGEVLSGAVVVCLAWDEEAKQAKAACGIKPLNRGDMRVAEIQWLTGREMKSWVHLLPQLEKFVTDPAEIGGLDCTIIKPIVRPGWVKILKRHGYRVTHAVMEKQYAR
jgi:hypothetical protein